MGSPCQLRLYHTHQAAADDVAAPLMAEARRLESLYSRYLENSLISRINQASGLAPVVLDAETAHLINYAQTVYTQSDGLFDITSGVLRRAWNFQTPRLPVQSELDTLLPLVGWEKVQWQTPNIRLPLAGMQVDLGGFVKEYAADAIAKLALEQGISRGLVELGGDIRVIGEGRWPLGVRNPQQPDQALWRLELAAGGFASSGNYERHFDLNGNRYSHILNPKTGWPVITPASVSVLADSCLLAGTVTTVAMLKGEEGCLTWLDEIGLPYLCVFNDGRIVNRF